MLVTIILVATGLGREQINQGIQKKYFNGEKMSYFNALLIDSGEPKRVEEKMKSLPGVKAVVRAKDNRIEESISKLKQRYSNLFNGSGLTNLVGLKVIYEQGIDARSQNLIKEYLERLVGPERVKLSKVFIPSKNIEKSLFLKKGMGTILLVFSLLLWFIPFVLLKKEFNQKFDLMMTFQRRQNIQFKVFGTSMFILLLFGFVTHAALFSFSIKTSIQTLVIITSLSFLFFDRLRWQN